MNASERDQLQQFLTALQRTRADPKDAVADTLIREAVASQADAPYLLVQRAMGVGLALEAAQTRIQQLETQCAELQTCLQAAQKATAFNGTNAGSGAASFLNAGAQSWGRAPEAPKPQTASMAPMAPMASMSSAPMQANRPVGTAPAAAAQANASPWGSGLMAQVATTAAGVVAGGLLFQGVQSLMGHNSPSPSSLSNAKEQPAPETAAHEASAGGFADAGGVADAGSVADAGGMDDMSWDQGEDWA